MSTKTIKTIAAGALLATTILSSAAANAGDSGKHYVSLTGEYIASARADGAGVVNNVSIPGSIDYKNGVAGLVAIGYYISDNVRTEIEGGYRHLNGDTLTFTVDGIKYTVSASDKQVKAFSGMANIYYNFPTDGNLTPYIGVGAGLALEQEQGSNAFAYQTMAGLDYKVSSNSTVFAGYRYFGTTEFSNTYYVAGLGVVTEKASVMAHAIDVGYRFSF